MHDFIADIADMLKVTLKLVIAWLDVISLPNWDYPDDRDTPLAVCAFYKELEATRKRSNYFECLHRYWLELLNAKEGSIARNSRTFYYVLNSGDFFGWG